MWLWFNSSPKSFCRTCPSYRSSARSFTMILSPTRTSFIQSIKTYVNRIKVSSSVLTIFLQQWVSEKTEHVLRNLSQGHKSDILGVSFAGPAVGVCKPLALGYFTDFIGTGSLNSSWLAQGLCDSAEARALLIRWYADHHRPAGT